MQFFLVEKVKNLCDLSIPGTQYIDVDELINGD